MPAFEDFPHHGDHLENDKRQALLVFYLLALVILLSVIVGLVALALAGVL